MNCLKLISLAAMNSLVTLKTATTLSGIIHEVSNAFFEHNNNNMIERNPTDLEIYYLKNVKRKGPIKKIIIETNKFHINALPNNIT